MNRRKPRHFKSEFKDWDLSLDELRGYFREFEALYGFEDLVIQPQRWVTITDIPKFLESSFATCGNYKGNPYFDPYLSSLYEVKEALENELKALKEIETRK